MPESGLLIPDHWKYYERDAKSSSVTGIQKGDNCEYLRWMGEELQTQNAGSVRRYKESEYFFDDQGLALGFRRMSPVYTFGADRQRFYTVYPHRELNTYYRWDMRLDELNNRWYSSGGGISPQIWFGRLFIDHGSQGQLEEMHRSLGSVDFSRGHLKKVNFGKIFLNNRDLKEFPSLGQPSLNIPTDATGLEDFQFRLTGHIQDGQDLTKVDRVGSCAYLVSAANGEPTYTVSWWEKSRRLFVVQEHISTKVRKTIMVPYNFDVSVAAKQAVADIDILQSRDAAMDPWIAMASVVGSHFSVGGGAIGRMFGE